MIIDGAVPHYFLESSYFLSEQQLTLSFERAVWQADEQAPSALLNLEILQVEDDMQGIELASAKLTEAGYEITFQKENFPEFLNPSALMALSFYTIDGQPIYASEEVAQVYGGVTVYSPSVESTVSFNETIGATIEVTTLFGITF